MPKKVLTIKQAVDLSRSLHAKGKPLVLAGGCFDILHPGHVIFLEKAKKRGDVLLVFLESDEKIKKIKGKQRPVHTQKERARVLSALEPVDYILNLPFLQKDSDYDRLIGRVNPDIIAATKGDKGLIHKKRIAKQTGAKLVVVTKMIGSFSTSAVLALNTHKT